MKIETSASTAKIAASLHAVMQDVSYVQRSGVNTFHKYRYASEADLLEKLRPALIRHGLILIPSARTVAAPDQWGNVTLVVEYTLLHKDGDIWPEKIKAPGCGNDRAKDGKVGDKGLYKALTGANKYLLFKLFQIETGDDPENEEHHDAEATRPQHKARQVLPPEDIVTMGSDKDVKLEQQQPISTRGYDTSGKGDYIEGPPHKPDPIEGYHPPGGRPSKQVYIENTIKLIQEIESAPELLRRMKEERQLVWPQYGIEGHDEDGQRLVYAYKERMAVLEHIDEDADRD